MYPVVNKYIYVLCTVAHHSVDRAIYSRAMSFLNLLRRTKVVTVNDDIRVPSHSITDTLQSCALSLPLSN